MRYKSSVKEFPVECNTSANNIKTYILKMATDLCYQLKINNGVVIGNKIWN